MNKIDLCFSSKGDNFSRMKGDPFSDRERDGERDGGREGGPESMPYRYHDGERESTPYRERDGEHDDTPYRYHDGERESTPFHDSNPLLHAHDEPFGDAIANMLLSSPPRRKRYADTCAPLDPDLLRAYPVTASEEQCTVLSVSLDPVQVFNNFVESLRGTYNSAKSVALSLSSSISESLTASKTMKSTAKKLNKLMVIESKLEANEVIIDYPFIHAHDSPHVETMKKALAELPPGSATAETLMTFIEAFEDMGNNLTFEPHDEVIGKNAFIIRDVKLSRNPLRWMKNLTIDEHGRFIFMKDFYRTHQLGSNVNALPMVLTRVGSNVFVAEPLIKDPVMRLAEKWFNVPDSLEEFHELAKYVAIADVRGSEGSDDANETRHRSHLRRERGRTTLLRIGNRYVKVYVQGPVQESVLTLDECDGSDDSDLREMVNDDLWNTVNDLDSANALI